jgi:ABC-type antimicrobial peptide transport system permease subunit
VRVFADGPSRPARARVFPRTRRQQIGVLRAIGFRRLQWSVLVESSFIALTSIVLGTALGLAVAFNVIHDSQQQPSWSNLTFDPPWLMLGIIFVLV